MAEAKKNENFWLNLGFNIVAPSLLLIKGEKIATWFGADANSAQTNAIILAIALAFPLCYGIGDLIVRKKWNAFSIIGILSVALTGGIGLLKLSRECMIIKETCVPLLLALVTLATTYTKKPLARILLMNDSIVDTAKINAALDARNTRAEFDKQLKSATWIVAFSFFLSAALNFALASYIFKSEAGTPAFNEEIGRMTALSFPAIALPATIILCFALYKLFNATTKLTGIPFEELMNKKD